MPRNNIATSIRRSMKSAVLNRLSQTVVREFLVERRDHCVEGNSMRPSLSNGQRIMLSPITAPLTIGHFYIFSFNNRLVLHRLVALNGTSAFFMGDHSMSVEEAPISSIIAEYDNAYHYPKLAIISFINTVCFFLGRKQGDFHFIQIMRMWSIKALLKGICHEKRI
jgi:hypothetical protein